MRSREFKLDPNVGLKWIWGKGLIHFDEEVMMEEEDEIQQMKHHSPWLFFDDYLNFNDPKYQSLDALLSKGVKEKEKSCLHWGGKHIKMFDGTVLTTSLMDGFVLIQETIDNLIKISTRYHKCVAGVCQMSVIMEVESEEIEMQFENDYPKVSMNGESLTVPGHHNGILFEVIGDWLIIEVPGLGFNLFVTNDNLLQIKLSTSLWKRTVGLCGTLSGNYMDDFHDINGGNIDGYKQLINNWMIENHKVFTQSSSHPCRERRMEQTASTFCQRLLHNENLQECYESVNPLPYFEACKWSYCENSDQLIESHCQSVASYVNTCREEGITVSNWRQPDFCGKDIIPNLIQIQNTFIEIECAPGFEYKSCGNVESLECGNSLETEISEFCIEGCYCPSGTSLNDGVCIQTESCPCYYNGLSYSSGSQVEKDCNTW